MKKVKITQGHVGSFVKKTYKSQVFMLAIMISRKIYKEHLMEKVQQ